MKTLFVAFAVLGLSAASASAECAVKHQAKAGADTMTTASIAAPQTSQSQDQAKPVLIEKKK